jgi:hypothetical protein
VVFLRPEGLEAQLCLAGDRGVFLLGALLPQRDICVVDRVAA